MPLPSVSPHRMHLPVRSVGVTEKYLFLLFSHSSQKKSQKEAEGASYRSYAMNKNKLDIRYGDRGPSATWQRTYFLCHLFFTFHSLSSTYITIFGKQLIFAHILFTT